MFHIEAWRLPDIRLSLRDALSPVCPLCNLPMGTWNPCSPFQPSLRRSETSWSR
jgi:hypothetical protein